jgi:hypothetical protein
MGPVNKCQFDESSIQMRRLSHLMGAIASRGRMDMKPKEYDMHSSILDCRCNQLLGDVRITRDCAK